MITFDKIQNHLRELAGAHNLAENASKTNVEPLRERNYREYGQTRGSDEECDCRAFGALCWDCAEKPKQPLSADDIRNTKFDREPWSGKIFDETKLALAVQVLKSIRDEQRGANSAVKALAEAALEVLTE